MVHPVSLYLDSVSYSRPDSCLGIWCYFSLTGQRHLLAVLRHSEMCTCGCKGWCSMHPIWSMIAWSLEHMLEGKHPDTRHDGTPFGPLDGERQRVAGQPLGWKAVCVFVKSDLMEHSTSLGLPGLADTISPCPFCFCHGGTLYGYTPLGRAWPVKRPQHYQAAASACEVVVSLGSSDRAEVRAALFYDKRKQGNKGRCGTCGFPPAWS